MSAILFHLRSNSRDDQSSKGRDSKDDRLGNDRFSNDRWRDCRFPPIARRKFQGTLACRSAYNKELLEVRSSTSVSLKG